MPRNGPTLVVNISLMGPEEDFDEEVTFLDRPYRIVRVGTDGDLDLAVEQVNYWAGDAGAIALSGVTQAHAAGVLKGRPVDTRERLEKAAGHRPVTDGHGLHAVFQEWAIRHVQAELPGFFSNARTVVLGGANHGPSIKALREHTANFAFADPGLRFDVDRLADTHPLIGPAVRLTSWATWPTRLLPQALRATADYPAQLMSDLLTRRAAQDSDVIVATYEELAAFDLADLTGKTVVSSAISEERLADLAERGVAMVVDATPQPFDVAVQTALVEAMMLIATGAPDQPLGTDTMLSLIERSELRPRLLHPNGPQRKSRFAFVIHPLSQEYFKNVEPLGAIAKVAPGPVMDVVEKAAAYLPPFTYSHITGITSPTGAEAEGWLISVGGTPKELMAHSPEFTYARLLTAAETARKLGAQVMGLGAFTKVVGDAGVTVAKQASLPITTGNSYSASGALWAAHDALLRLGLAEFDEHGRMLGSAMVIGATGAIGSVCARLLALACDELWLVSPESAKLLELKHDIERENPRAVVHVSATPDDHIADVDLIVTATSGAGKKVLDIEMVKPGCVITDVARPLDLSAADVALRPDVLVVESGEVQLPGDVRMRDIGLPPGVAYACLAETVVLALEGRYETFTVGRNIEWEKVKEIYQLGLKHGMKLATISGVNGPFSDDDIARIRELAVERRAAAPVAAPSTG